MILPCPRRPAPPCRGYDSLYALYGNARALDTAHVIE
jgi:hypothetical protein